MVVQWLANYPHPVGGSSDLGQQWFSSLGLGTKELEIEQGKGQSKKGPVDSSTWSQM